MTPTPAPSSSATTSTPAPTPAPSSSTSTSTPFPLVAPASGSEWLDFIASVVASTAWPIVVLILLLTFKEQITSLATAVRDRMPAMERFKTPWGEMVWSSATVETVSEEVDATLPPRQKEGGERLPDTRTERAVQLAKVDPSAGVLHAFLDVEIEGEKLLRRLGVPWRGSPMAALRRSEKVPAYLRSVVADLSQLRNAAAHGRGDVSLASALSYIETAERVAAELRATAAEAEGGDSSALGS